MKRLTLWTFRKSRLVHRAEQRETFWWKITFFAEIPSPRPNQLPANFSSKSHSSSEARTWKNLKSPGWMNFCFKAKKVSLISYIHDLLSQVRSILGSIDISHIKAITLNKSVMYFTNWPGRSLDIVIEKEIKLSTDIKIYEKYLRYHENIIKYLSKVRILVLHFLPIHFLRHFHLFAYFFLKRRLKKWRNSLCFSSFSIKIISSNKVLCNRDRASDLGLKKSRTMINENFIDVLDSIACFLLSWILSKLLLVQIPIVSTIFFLDLMMRRGNNENLQLEH